MVRDVLDDGRLVVKILDELFVVDPRTGEIELEMTQGRHAVNVPGRDALAVIDFNGMVRVVDTTRGDLLVEPHRPYAHRSVPFAWGPRGIDVSPDAQHLLVSYEHGACVIWNPWEGSEPIVLEHDGIVAAAFVSDELVLTACADGWARLWDWRRAEVMEAHDCGDDAFSAAVAPGGRHFGIGLRNGDTIVWERGKERLCRLRAHRGVVWPVAFLAEGAVVTASIDGTARIWRYDEESLRRAANEVPFRDFRASERVEYRELLEPVAGPASSEEGGEPR